MVKTSLVLAGVASVFLLPASGQCSTLFSENFNGLTPSLTATSVGGFSAINGTNVDILGGPVFGSLCAAPESGNCVDLNGTGGNSQGVLSSNSAFSLTPGVTYTLSFDLIGSGRGVTSSTTVSFGPYSKTFTLSSSDVSSGIVSVPVSVSSPTTANLKFASNTAGNMGALLDDVVLTSDGPAADHASDSAMVPEPMSWGLMLLALAALGGGRLLQKKFTGRR